MAWPFQDAPDVAVFTSRHIVSGAEWIHYVAHDREDRAWQFHPASGFTPESEAAVVALGEIYALDPSIAQISDLPLGWCAWRYSRTDRWRRAEKGSLGRG